jgi:hypothetical protein
MLTRRCVACADGQLVVARTNQIMAPILSDKNDAP